MATVAPARTPLTVPRYTPGESQTSGKASRRRFPSVRRRREPSLIGLAYSAPALVLYGLFVVVPFVYAVYLSFFEWGGAGDLTFVGWANYEGIWDNPELAASFLHAAILVIFFAALPIAIGLLLTALMTRARMRGLTFYRTILFLPQVIALVAIAVVWEWILSPGGPVDSIIGQQTAWLGSFTWALPAIGIIGSWIGYGFAMVCFMAGAEKIPQSLYDSAQIDGASWCKEFLHVTFPGLRNELTVVSVVTVTSALTTFDVVYVITSGGPGTSTVMPAYSVYQLAFIDFREGAAAALGVVLSLIVFAVALLIMWLGRSREDRQYA